MSFLNLSVGQNTFAIYIFSMVLCMIGSKKMGISGLLMPLASILSSIFSKNWLFVGWLVFWVYPLLVLSVIFDFNISRIFFTILLLILLFLPKIGFLASILGKSVYDNGRPAPALYHFNYLYSFAFMMVCLYEIFRAFHIELSIYFFICLLILGYIVLASMQYYKYNQANELEKQQYFPKNVLYTYHKMSKVPYTPLPNLLVNSHTVVEVTSNQDLQKDNFYLLRSYQFGVGETFIQQYAFGIAQILPKKTPHYYLNIHYQENTIDYTIKNTNKETLWQATSYKILQNKQWEFYPNYYSILEKAFNKNVYFTDKNRLLQVFANPQPFSQTYQVKQVNDDVIEINQHLFRLNDGKFTNYQAWCSENYLVLGVTRNQQDIYNHLFFFDKNQTEPLFSLRRLDEIENPNIKLDKELSFYQNIKKLLQQNPEILTVHSISMDKVIYDKNTKCYQLLQDKSNIQHDKTTDVVILHTDFGMILYTEA